MAVIWITGLSGAGKTSLAREVVKSLKVLQKPVLWLDGDELRKTLGVENSYSTDFSVEARLMLSKTYSRLCKLISDQEMIVVISTIALFHEVHEWNRKNLNDYFEVYLEVPLQVLKQRDPKGIYKDASVNRKASVVGLNLDFERPLNPDWLVRYDARKPPHMLATELLDRFNRMVKL